MFTHRMSNLQTRTPYRIAEHAEACMRTCSTSARTRTVTRGGPRGGQHGKDFRPHIAFPNLHHLRWAARSRTARAKGAQPKLLPKPLRITSVWVRKRRNSEHAAPSRVVVGQTEAFLHRCCLRVPPRSARPWGKDRVAVHHQGRIFPGVEAILVIMSSQLVVALFTPQHVDSEQIHTLPNR